MNEPLTLEKTLLRGLACAALEPALRRVLLFDATFETLETAVPLLQAMLQTTTGTKANIVTLSANVMDDALWGSLTPHLPETGINPRQSTGLAVRWQDGLLTQNRSSLDWLLVVIPDLTRLSLAAARTCIMLLDAPVVHLQRDSQDAAWQPRICWLAACERERVGRVSSHLLDRFALRLSAPEDSLHHNPSDILTWLEGVPDYLPHLGNEQPDWRLSGEIGDWLKTAVKQQAVMTETAVERILAYIPSGAAGIRRELALARLSVAEARLSASKEVLATHVDMAAKLIGFTTTTSESDPPPPTQDRPADTISSRTKQDSDIVDDSQRDKQTSSADDSSKVYDPGEPEEQGVAPLFSASPYPEDTATIERELFALRLPMRRYNTTAAERGAVIGVQTANSFHDLALLPTILEAATYQKIRQSKQTRGNGRLQIYPRDLRRYRRSPAVEQMLLILLDYTSLRDCKWQEALLPHLRWAYVVRASVGIIQVGAADAVDELRAYKVTANSILTPRIGQALESQPGRATPLAHGLEMAYQMLQQAQEHGRNLIQHTRFVLITDGRGNVPLTASHCGEIQMPVRREGIEDALKVAHEFCSLRRVLPILLDPQPIYHAELPVELAEALAAVHEKIPLIEEAQLL